MTSKENKGFQSSDSEEKRKKERGTGGGEEGAS